MSLNRHAHEDSRSPETAGPLFELVRPAQAAVEPEPHTIHLVDCNSNTLLTFFEALSSAGYQVSASSDTTDAMGFVSRSRPELLIVELEMGEMSGMELCQRAVAASPATRILLTSERPLSSVHEDWLRRIHAAHLPKPASSKELLGTVARIFR